ncbi:hypothetical protein PIB30_113914, partial [Stylosanthes scabra]|nr:hypothetical protein [Stylosanthes scabra]
FIREDQPVEQASYMGNQQWQPFQNPNSNTYNPGWRNHPNFGWGGDQNPRNNNFQTRPPFQPQQRPPYQQPPPFSQQNNLHQPPKPQPTSFEAALEKLTLTTTTFVQSTNNFMEETRANLRNQESAIRNLETQVGQIARQISTTLPNAFPSDTQVNPKECKAVTLRS